MARYFFNAEDGECVPDRDGLELATFEEAQAAAVRYLCESLDDRPDKVWNTGAYRITVSDARGLNLFIIDVTTVLAAACPPLRRKRG
jgi:hypothetical protein